MHFDINNGSKSYKTEDNATKAIEAYITKRRIREDSTIRYRITYIIVGNREGRFQPVIFLRAGATHLAIDFVHKGFTVIA